MGASLEDVLKWNGWRCFYSNAWEWKRLGWKRPGDGRSMIG
jgi:hypothetical protein